MSQEEPMRQTNSKVRMQHSPRENSQLSNNSNRKGAQTEPADESKNELDIGLDPLSSQLTPSTSSSVSVDEACERMEQIDLAETLPEDTLKTIAQFVMTVLKLDFAEEWNGQFRESSLLLLTKQLRLPTKFHAQLKKEMETERTEDIFTLIIKLKEEPYIKEHGSIIILAELVGLFVRTGVYDCRFRVLLHHVSALLGVRWEEVESVEDDVAHLLIEESYVETEKEEANSIKPEALAAKQRTAKRKKIKRYAMIGATGAVGGVLIGLTGGLAAPLFAAGAGVVIGTGAAAGIATVTGAAILGSLFGVAGAGLSGYKMNKRVGDIEEFVVETLSDGQSLHCVIAVSGWIEEDREDAFRWAWRHLNHSKEQYCLRYESQYLLELGKAMDYFMSMAVTYAVHQTLMETALATLVSAIAWPMALISVASVIDNPWNICVRRAQEVGHHMADILLSRQQGQRPVTLIGFSLGARVIYHCLLEMGRRPNFDGVVEDVILLGAPVAGSKKEWRQLCRVVGGRVINGYSKADWLLKFLYRTMSAQLSIAGTAPVETGERKIVNFNLTHLISGHLDYRHKLTEVLEAVGVRVTPHSDISFQNLAEARAATQRRSNTNSAVSTPSRTGSSSSLAAIKSPQSFKSFPSPKKPPFNPEDKQTGQ